MANVQISFDRQTADRLRKEMQKIPWYLREEELQKAKRKSGNVVKRKIKEVIQAKGLVDEGDLLNSIAIITRISKHGEIFIGPRYKRRGGKGSANHAHLVEFGFMHKSGKVVAPRPFMRPGYEAAKTEALKKLSDEIEKIIKKIGNAG